MVVGIGSAVARGGEVVSCGRTCEGGDSKLLTNGQIV